jgi:hypothetical protein
MCVLFDQCIERQALYALQLLQTAAALLLCGSTQDSCTAPVYLNLMYICCCCLLLLLLLLCDSITKLSLLVQYVHQ